MLAKQYFGKNEQYYANEMLESYLNGPKNKAVLGESKTSDHFEDQNKPEIRMVEEKPNERCFILVTPSQEEANKMVEEMMSGHRSEQTNPQKRSVPFPLPIKPKSKEFKPNEKSTGTIQNKKDNQKDQKDEMIDEEEEIEYLSD